MSTRVTVGALAIAPGLHDFLRQALDETGGRGHATTATEVDMIARARRWVVLAVLVSQAAFAEPGVLFRDVNVVATEQGTILEHRDVLVRDGRIERIAPTGRHRVDASESVIEAKGRYMMPGLAEMHVHVPQAESIDSVADMLFLFVAHGVTSIRSTVGDPTHLQLRDRVNRGELISPRMHIAAPAFRATNTGDAAEVRVRIQGYAKSGYDFLKLHPSLQRPAFDVIAAASQSSGIPFEGHVPESVGLERALSAHIRAIDHIDGFVQALADPKCTQLPKAAGFFGIAYTPCVDMSRLPALLEQTRATGTWIVPTLTHLEIWTHLTSWDVLAARPQMRYVPVATREKWRQLHASLIPDLPPGERADRFIQVMETILREAQAAGIPMALGSDTPQAFNVPGASALEEMTLLVRAGLTPAQVLRIATGNPARFMESPQRSGVIAEGMDADLILIAGNPLSDISAVGKLQGVMLRGRWLDRATIDRGLDDIAARAAAGE